MFTPWSINQNVASTVAATSIKEMVTISRENITQGGSLSTWQIERLLLPKLTLINSSNCPTNLEEERSRYGCKEAISSLVFSPDGSFLSVINGQCVSMYDPRRHTIWKSLPKATQGSLITCQVYTGERKLTLGDDRGRLVLYDCRKLSQPLNIVQAHDSQLNSTIYSRNNNWLISSDTKGLVQYHSIPAIEITSDRGQLEKGLHYDTLFNCPMLSQLALSSDENTMALSLTNSGSLFLINRLYMRSLAEDLKNIRFDDSLKMYLVMFPPHSSELHQRNSISILDQDEITPHIDTTISKYSQLQFISKSEKSELFSTSPAAISSNSSSDSTVLLTKFTTKKRTVLGMETKDWLSFIQLKPLQGELAKSAGRIASLEEHCLFTIEEPRFATLNEKKASLTKCSRLVATPCKNSLRLFTFSRQLQSLHEVIHKKKSQNFMNKLFSDSGGPQYLEHYKELPVSSEGLILKCQFSPIDSTLLVAGDNQGTVHFYQPRF